MDDYDRVPQELKDLKRWMLRDYKSRGTKIPQQAGGAAWGRIDEATNNGFDTD